MPALGFSLFLIAVGAILDFAVRSSGGHGINIHTIGAILLGVGALGTLLSMLFWTSWAPLARRDYPDSDVHLHTP